MKNRSLFSQSLRTRFFSGLLLAAVTIGLAACGRDYYKFPQYTYANRPVPPSKLANRVMVSLTVNGSTGSLQILDALRDIRNNIENTVSSFTISGYSGGYPSRIYNFPAEVAGYVYDNSQGSLTKIDYGKEASAGSAGTLGGLAPSIAIPPSFNHIYAAVQANGQLVVIDNTVGKTYALNLPNVYSVSANIGDTVVLAMVRNSNTLYRLIKLNSNKTAPPGAIDCQPVILPVYCVVPVPDSSSSPSFDHPVSAYFSLDGWTAYLLNCGPECGGSTASITMMPIAPLQVTVCPTPASDTSGVPECPTSGSDTSPVTGHLNIPGGVTTALSDGSTLYLAGQQLQADGLFTGFLTTVDQGSNTITGQYSISDGYHTKLLFADDNTLWIGSQSCATGERQHQATLGNTTQAANYNCLSRFDLGAKSVTIVPAVNQNTGTAVGYPNTNQNQYYYGDLTGLCWVQGLHKVYTAYGGQVHAFNTADGSEINNYLITVQGTALDVAYMDALSDSAD